VNAAAMSVLRECHLNLLRASVTAEHARTLLSGPVHARELVGKVNRCTHPYWAAGGRHRRDRAVSVWCSSRPCTRLRGAG
jgi:hypothetical protein